MTVKIRLARWGRRHQPFYGIVIQNHFAPRDGKHLERVGTYNALPDKDGVKHIELNVPRIKYWLGAGAEPTEKVAWLLAKANLMPLTPKQLQYYGRHSLTDPKTWDVEVRDAEGKVIGMLPAPVAREKFANHPVVGPQLPRDRPLESEPVPWILDASTIRLDGRPPKAPLDDGERLLVLKKFIDID
ncbi:hypothetical protein HK104_005567 [Borealophlyctis nickersoniae]|nr:hypothetical protein HK104_005567 [Borealophlyctis nickersoniae]